MARGDPTQPCKPFPILIGSIEATVEFVNDQMGYYVATVPGEGPVSGRRVFLRKYTEGKTWRRA
jgi:hypothetical protein